MAVLEKDIQRKICDYLAIKGYFFWRSNNIPVFSEGRYRAMPSYSLNGIPDIIVVSGGQFIGLEVKRPKGIQSESQKLFQQKLEKAGGQYFVVKSVQDVIDLGL